jgi:hypothetical protein
MTSPQPISDLGTNVSGAVVATPSEGLASSHSKAAPLASSDEFYLAYARAKKCVAAFFAWLDPERVERTEE